MMIRDEDRIHSHGGYVQFIQGGPRKGWCFGVCASCGWQGDDRESERRAEVERLREALALGNRLSVREREAILRPSEEKGLEVDEYDAERDRRDDDQWKDS